MIDILGIEPKEDARKPSEKVDEFTATPADEAIDEFFALHKSGDMRGAREAFKSAARLCAMEENETEPGEGY